MYRLLLVFAYDIFTYYNMCYNITCFVTEWLKELDLKSWNLVWKKVGNVGSIKIGLLEIPTGMGNHECGFYVVKSTQTKVRLVMEPNINITIRNILKFCNKNKTPPLATCK